MSEQDTEKLLVDSVNDAARTVNGRFVTFLTVGAYIAVTVASTTDESLVRGSLVTLPLLNVNIPTIGPFGFYMVAPWLILALHWDLLLQLSVLSRKVLRFHDAFAGSSQEQRDALRDRLATYHYIRFLSGEQSGRLGSVLRAIPIFGSMVVLPLVLLCFTHFRSLPLRDFWVTVSQRLALSIDVLVILIVLYPIAQRDARGSTEPTGHGHLRSLLSLRNGVIAACLSVFVLSVLAWYHERADFRTSRWHRTTLDLRFRDLTGGNLAPGTINRLMDGDVQQQDDELASIAQSHLLQGRDLRGANFYTAALPKLDLRTLKGDKPGHDKVTSLRRANLSWALMQKVLLNDTDLSEANLNGTWLQGAQMVNTKLPRAQLDDAKLQEANLSGAGLEGAVLRRAQLQGATLVGTTLRRTKLANANLKGANLRGADLQKSDLSEADLEGADLSGADLRGALLRGAKLEGSRWCKTKIDKADLEGTNCAPVDVCAVNDPPPLGGTRQCCMSRTCGSCEGSALRDHLVELACDDPYAARGLSRQALAKDAELSDFAEKLVAKASDKDCPGVRLLPADMLGDLRNLHKDSAPLHPVEQ